MNQQLNNTDTVKVVNEFELRPTVPVTTHDVDQECIRSTLKTNSIGNAEDVKAFHSTLLP